MTEDSFQCSTHTQRLCTAPAIFRALSRESSLVSASVTPGSTSRARAYRSPLSHVGDGYVLTSKLNLLSSSVTEF